MGVRSDAPGYRLVKVNVVVEGVIPVTGHVLAEVQCTLIIDMKVIIIVAVVDIGEQVSTKPWELHSTQIQMHIQMAPRPVSRPGFLTARMSPGC